MMPDTAALPRIAPELADLPHVPISALIPFQGELKELSEREYNKLKKSITDNGLFVPFFVWKENGKLLDGHQRLRVFIREGWQLDVPVIWISAASEQEAKQKLLLISSQYGRVTQEGWDSFTFDLEDDWIKSSVNFDALPFVFGVWLDNQDEQVDPNEEWQGMPEFDNEAIEAYKTIKVHFKSKPDYDDFAELIDQPLTDKTIYIYYPRQPVENLKLYRVIDES